MRIEDLARLVDDRVDQGEFNVHRDIFRDPDVFEMEMRHVFEGTWIFLGLANQLPKPNDFYTTWIGRQPVVLMRDPKGKLGAFLNSCRHRGAVVCHTERGNARYHVCQYHGWVYDSAGKNADIKDRKAGCYSPSFDGQDHNLVALPHFGEYRGFLFGSLNPAVPPLEEHLGETRKFFDLIVDQSPQGVELVPGSSMYVFKGNWKLQIENCLDLYHLTSVHSSFMDLVEKRNAGESGNQLDVIDLAALKRPDVVRGSYTFKHGHAITWGFNPKPETRPLYALREELLKRVGEVRTKWMLGSRNMTVYPNAQFAENASLQLRIIRPLSVDRTEMKIYCMAPIGEPKEARRFRLRQFEDFFNVTGLATPDDNICYEDCQTGYRARLLSQQQGYARGITSVRRGPDQYAAEIGLNPETSVAGAFDMSDETVFHSSYREWLRLMKAGVRHE